MGKGAPIGAMRTGERTLATIAGVLWGLAIFSIIGGGGHEASSSSMSADLLLLVVEWVAVGDSFPSVYCTRLVVVNRMCLLDLFVSTEKVVLHIMFETIALMRLGVALGMTLELAVVFMMLCVCGSVTRINCLYYVIFFSGRVYILFFFSARAVLDPPSKTLKTSNDSIHLMFF